MARLSKQVVQERELYLYKLFSEKPNLTAKSANEALKKEYKSNMRAQRVFEIKRLAAEGKALFPEHKPGSKGSKAAAKTSAAKGSKATSKKAAAPAEEKAAEPSSTAGKILTAARGAKGKNGSVGYGAEADALSRAIKAMQEVGCTNVRITYTPPERTVEA